MSEGYIRSIVIDEQLSAATIAACCKMPEDRYRREIDAVIASIMHCTVTDKISSKIIFHNNGKPTDQYNLRLAATLNDKGNMLIFEFIDSDRNKIINSIEMPFRLIRAAFEPHREYRDSAATRYPHKLIPNIEFLENTGKEAHIYAIKGLGFWHQDKLQKYNPQTINGIGMNYSMQKYLSGLVLALFPNGPHSEWKLAAPRPELATGNPDKPNPK